ncbi:MAG: hypothetical protein DRJ35_08630 [Thermoprotei archaeon]|nr:MAG: hypothetical protein DRJ35_08630 [Thermoprotei archaeon]
MESVLVVSVPYMDLGMHTFKLVAISKFAGNLEEEWVVNVASPYKLVVDKNVDCFLNEVCSKDLKVLIENSTPIDTDTFALTNFWARMGENIPLTIGNVNCKGFVCIFPLTFPWMSAGKHTLYVGLSIGSLNLSSNLTVLVHFRLTGVVKTPDERFIDVSFNIKDLKSGVVKTFRTNRFGNYSFDLLPGIYDFQLTFPNGISAKFNKVDLRNVDPQFLKNFVNFDEFYSNIFDGIDVLKSFVVEFGLPYQNGKITVNLKKSVDWNKLSVWVCHDWIFSQRKCGGNWEKIEPRIQKVFNSVEINFTRLSFFVIGVRKSLRVEYRIGKKIVYGNERLKVSGMVFDDRNATVNGAKITVEFEETNQRSETLSNVGSFEVFVNAPKTQGQFNLHLKVEKGFYEPIDVVIPIKVVALKRVDVNIPELIDVKQGEEKRLVLAIKNSGQVNFTNVRLFVKGLNKEWYYLMPPFLNSLNEGEVKKVEFVIKVPKNETIMHVYPLQFVVLSDQIEKYYNFVLRVELPQIQNTTKEEPTGYMVVPKEIEKISVQLFMAMTIIILILFLIASKRKRESEEKVNVKVIKKFLRGE